MTLKRFCVRSLSRVSRKFYTRCYSDDTNKKPPIVLQNNERKPLKLYGVNSNTNAILNNENKDYLNKDTKKLERELIHRIKLGGPITVAQYMQEVLTNPLSGYYIGAEVFGTRGDFITSPEISQMFGECIAIWLLNEWFKMGKPKPLKIVELGPGKGTLMQDICRTIFKLAPKVSSTIITTTTVQTLFHGHFPHSCFNSNTFIDHTFYRICQKIVCLFILLK